MQQGNETYRLVVRRGPQPNQIYELTEDVINLGRDITNDIVINDREVSRHHLRLMHGTDGYTIEDLGSTNGTFVNGKRVTGATLLKNGDMIGLGETVTLGYELVRSDAPTASPPPPQEDVPESPYQRPQEAPVDPYQPPREAYPQEPEGYQQPDPYRAPEGAAQPQAEPYPYAQQQPGYAPAGNQGYYPQAAQQAQQPYYGATPPPPGYDYDPYAMREEEGGGVWRIVFFGCLGLMLFCCCITVLAAVVIDTLNIYCDIPVLRDILIELGLLTCQAL